MSELLRLKYVKWAWNAAINGMLGAHSIQGKTLLRLRRMYGCSISAAKPSKALR